MFIIIVRGTTNGAILDAHAIAARGVHPRSTTGRFIPVSFTISSAAGPRLSTRRPNTRNIPTKPIPIVRAALNALLTFTPRHIAIMNITTGSITVGPMPRIY